jgi:hypothetical protein
VGGLPGSIAGRIGGGFVGGGGTLGGPGPGSGDSYGGSSLGGFSPGNQGGGGMGNAFSNNMGDILGIAGGINALSGAGTTSGSAATNAADPFAPYRANLASIVVLYSPVLLVTSNLCRGTPNTTLVLCNRLCKPLSVLLLVLDNSTLVVSNKLSKRQDKLATQTS